MKKEEKEMWSALTSAMSPYRGARKDKKMTLDEHMETADDLAIATHHLKKVFFRCQKHYLKSGRLMKLLHRVLPGVLNGVFTKIFSELDTEYHKLITNSEFRKHGQIYYDLEKRYKKIKQAD